MRIGRRILLTATGAALCMAVGACQDDNHRLDTIEQHQRDQDQEIIAATSTSSSTQAAAKSYADGIASAETTTIQAEAQRAQAAEAAEAKARMDAVAASVATAKTYTDQAVAGVKVPTVTHLKNLTTGQVLGERRGTYATAEVIGGEQVDLDWSTVLLRSWDKPGCALGGGRVFYVTQQNGPPAPPPSLLGSARYISIGHTVMQLDSDYVAFGRGSFEDSKGQCQPDSNSSVLGFPVTDSSPKNGSTDDGKPLQLAKPKELRTINVSPT
jgi:hypothetical protein